MRVSCAEVTAAAPNAPTVVVKKALLSISPLREVMNEINGARTSGFVFS